MAAGRPKLGNALTITYRNCLCLLIYQGTTVNGGQFEDWEILGNALVFNTVFCKISNIFKNRVESQSISQDLPISTLSAMYIMML